MVKIDFVLTWVDGSDPIWLEQKKRFSVQASINSQDDANNVCRYRDSGLLRYWFRSVERFAPWVNKIFFVTCGQKPKWLVDTHPKLRFVNHSDYIPTEYLPTFHSNTIELNLHRIKDLSEHFVLFNDDVFLLRPVKPDYFFNHGNPLLPCEIGIPWHMRYDNISHVMLNNSVVLKASMDVNRLIWKNWLKVFNIRALGFSRAFKNLAAIVVNKCCFLGTFGHLSHPHLKSTFETIWKKQPLVLDITSRHKFRNNDCVNHWLACGWNLANGHFCPVHEKSLGFVLKLCPDNLNKICIAIIKTECPQICVNDTLENIAPEQCFEDIRKAFHSILPDQSSFEKRL